MRYENVYYDGRLRHSSILETLCGRLDSYAKKTGDAVYVLQSALGSDGDYDYTDGVLVLIPRHSIAVVDLNNDINASIFKTFMDDIIDDIGYQSTKFEYKKVLGRSREWNKFVMPITIDELLNDFEIALKKLEVDKKNQRRVELLISLLIGSINDPFKVGAETPDSDLMKVKKNIILFDSTQSRFVYESTDNRMVTIQGLAGTGKTELLLHKLQKLYVKDDSSRIAFTCFNRILANDMEKRVTRFFNFMHVDKQIEWNKRLWVFRSWGSGTDKNSGLYSYICDFYDIPFIRYSENHNFSDVCQKAIDQISVRKHNRYCFDYLLIDESQDFSDAFFKLCSMVTKIQVIKAGDIFQNIFDMSFDGSVDCDYLLNKCYRTDPKTLMFAHAIGMGLYEKPVVRWLNDEEWNACGYELERNNGTVTLSRFPIRRFQDISSDVQSVVFAESKAESLINNVIRIIDNIIEKYPDVTPDDIGIVFTTRNNSVYEIMDRLASEVKERFDYNVTKGHLTKARETGHLFMSNINNVKGLEFPFVICIHVGDITRSVFQRNAIYMALTRSFLSSFFIVTSERNEKFIQEYQEAAKHIQACGKIVVRQPSQLEIQFQTEQIRIQTQNAKKSMEEIVYEICKEESRNNFISDEEMKRIYNSVASAIGENMEIDESTIRNIHISNITFNI